jgi:hypothetical protein
MYKFAVSAGQQWINRLLLEGPQPKRLTDLTQKRRIEGV